MISTEHLLQALSKALHRNWAAAARGSCRSHFPGIVRSKIAVKSSLFQGPFGVRWLLDVMFRGPLSTQNPLSCFSSTCMFSGRSIISNVAPKQVVADQVSGFPIREGGRGLVNTLGNAAG